MLRQEIPRPPAAAGMAVALTLGLCRVVRAFPEVTPRSLRLRGALHLTAAGAGAPPPTVRQRPAGEGGGRDWSKLDGK